MSGAVTNSSLALGVPSGRPGLHESNASQRIVEWISTQPERTRVVDETTATLTHDLSAAWGAISPTPGGISKQERQNAPAPHGAPPSERGTKAPSSSSGVLQPAHNHQPAKEFVWSSWPMTMPAPPWGTASTAGVEQSAQTTSRPHHQGDPDDNLWGRKLAEKAATPSTAAEREENPPSSVATTNTPSGGRPRNERGGVSGSRTSAENIQQLIDAATFGTPYDEGMYLRSIREARFRLEHRAEGAHLESNNGGGNCNPSERRRRRDFDLERAKYGSHRSDVLPPVVRRESPGAPRFDFHGQLLQPPRTLQTPPWSPELQLVHHCSLSEPTVNHLSAEEMRNRSMLLREEDICRRELSLWHEQSRVLARLVDNATDLRYQPGQGGSSVLHAKQKIASGPKGEEYYSYFDDGVDVHRQPSQHQRAMMMAPAAAARSHPLQPGGTDSSSGKRQQGRPAASPEAPRVTHPSPSLCPEEDADEDVEVGLRPKTTRTLHNNPPASDQQKAAPEPSRLNDVGKESSRLLLQPSHESAAEEKPDRVRESSNTNVANSQRGSNHTPMGTHHQTANHSVEPPVGDSAGGTRIADESSTQVPPTTSTSSTSTYPQARGGIVMPKRRELAVSSPDKKSSWMMKRDSDTSMANTAMGPSAVEVKNPSTTECASADHEATPCGGSPVPVAAQLIAECDEHRMPQVPTPFSTGSGGEDAAAVLASKSMKSGAEAFAWRSAQSGPLATPTTPDVAPLPVPNPLSSTLGPPSHTDTQGMNNDAEGAVVGVQKGGLSVPPSSFALSSNTNGMTPGSSALPEMEVREEDFPEGRPQSRGPSSADEYYSCEMSVDDTGRTHSWDEGPAPAATHRNQSLPSPSPQHAIDTHAAVLSDRCDYYYSPTPSVAQSRRNSNSGWEETIFPTKQRETHPHANSPRDKRRSAPSAGSSSSPGNCRQKNSFPSSSLARSPRRQDRTTVYRGGDPLARYHRTPYDEAEAGRDPQWKGFGAHPIAMASNGFLEQRFLPATTASGNTTDPPPPGDGPPPGPWNTYLRGRVVQ